MTARIKNHIKGGVGWYDFNSESTALTFTRAIESTVYPNTKTNHGLQEGTPNYFLPLSRIVIAVMF